VAWSDQFEKKELREIVSFYILSSVVTIEYSHPGEKTKAEWWVGNQDSDS
jgi:hypothetical protein